MLKQPNDQVFKTIPLKHQIECLMLSRDREFFGIFHEMGCGKSKVAIDTASYLFSRGKINGLIIIGPKSSLRSWYEQQLPAHMPDSVELKTLLWGPQTKAFETQSEKLFKVEPLKLAVLIMNIDATITDRGYDFLEKFLLCYDTCIVVDESTSIKNPKSSRTKILTKLGKRAHYRRILTGTPIANKPLDIYSQFNFLEEGCLGSSSWFAFRNRYAVTRTKYMNGRKFEEIIGWQRLDELYKETIKHSHRVLKKDCLDLPEKIYQTRYIELAPDQLRYYREMRDQALTVLNTGLMVGAPLVITRLMRLRQSLCNLAPTGDGDAGTVFISEKDSRLDEVIKIVEESGDQKILVWSCFTPSILRIVGALNEEFGEGTAAAFYGAVKPEERQALIDQIQEKEAKLKVLVLNPSTGGESITLTGASLVVYHDHDWSLKVREQSEDRAHRIGQVRNVTYIDLVAVGTVDELIVSALRDKKSLALAVTGDNLKQLLAGGAS